MATYKGGITFDGDPDEVVLATPQTIYDVIPDEAVDWKRMFNLLYGYSQPGKYWRKGDLFDYVLNVYARFFLPQYTYVGNTIYEAAHWFFLMEDLKPDNKLQPEDVLGLWTVTAQAVASTETTSEADPCYQRYKSETGAYTYFGWTPHPHRANPYPGPCKQQFEIMETAQGGPHYNPSNNDGFQWTFADGASTTYHKAGGWSAELTTVEVTEQGLLYVSLPRLPEGVTFPPPLVGRVVDYGVPGVPGPPGPPGPRGPAGFIQTPEQIADGFCAAGPSVQAQMRHCIGAGYPGEGTWAQVLGGTPLQYEALGEKILTEAPDTIIPETTLTVADVEEPILTAIKKPNGIGWTLTLVLPIALAAIRLLTETIQIFECDEQGRMGRKVISTPMLSLSGGSQGALWQYLFNTLGWLLRCCPPCDLDTWRLLGTFKGSKAFQDLDKFSAIRLVLRDKTKPEINAWYGNQSINKLGEVRWFYDDHIHPHPGPYIPRRSTLLFWNSIEQVFKTFGGDVTGFDVNQEYEKEYEVWIQYVLPDIAPPGL